MNSFAAFKFWAATLVAGNLYVLDTGNHRVQKFSPDGKYLATFGRQGQGPGEFYYASWLAVDANGFFYVSDPNNQRIQVLTPDGTGQFYLVFPVQNRIDKYAADGRLLWRADRELPYSMEIREKGKIERQGGGVSIRMPQMNRCAGGVAVDGIFIHGDRLFLMDKYRGTQFREYKIKL